MVRPIHSPAPNIRYPVFAAFVAVFVLATRPVSAQWVVDYDTEGVELENGVILKTQVDAESGYNDRAFYANGDAQDDFYTDIAAAASLENQPSVYNWLVKGRYGLRFSAEEEGYQDDFYSAGGSIKTDKKPFIWGASASLAKSLDYNTAYNSATGTTPDSILTYRVNTSMSAAANLAYEKKLFGKSSLVPGYGYSYSKRSYDDGGADDDSSTHRASLMAVHDYSAKTRFSAGLAYSLQSNQQEDGRIGTALAGVSYQLTAKTSLNASIGYAFADYADSGTDQGVVSSLKGSWQVSKKVSTYVFGGNDFQAGYGGASARRVYRLGYGAAWQALTKLGLSGSVLHDYQQAIGDGASANASYGTVRHYLNLAADYRPSDPLSIVAGITHNRDERPDPQNKIYLQAVYRFY
jgi:hypothetical protein